MNETDTISLGEARSTGATLLELRVVELRNDHSSWPATARTLGISVRSAREAWGRVNRRVRSNEAETRAHSSVEDATIGNEDLLRGIPVVGTVSGTIRGTRPGDPAWRAEADQHLPSRKRNA